MTIVGKRIAVLAEDYFETSELFEPVKKMKDEGGIVTIIGGRAGKAYADKTGQRKVTADKSADQVSADDFDAIIIPGGRAPERMRMNDAMVRLVKDMHEQGKPIAAICHGAQVLITGDLLRGRAATCWAGIRDDVKNAGADYRDEPVVIDGNLITSRKPEDVPQFNEAILKALSAAGVPASR